jgi:hypothetical protein
MTGCECGCGEPTAIARQSDSRYGWVKGQPVRFRPGHYQRGRHARPEFVVNDAGCWVWQRTIVRERPMRVVHGEKSRPAQLHYYEQEHGPLPVETTIEPACGEPLCVAPAHMQKRRKASYVAECTNDWPQPNHGKIWTGAEMEYASRDDLSIAEMARTLGRSWQAVSTLRFRISRDPRYLMAAGVPRDTPGADG